MNSYYWRKIWIHIIDERYEFILWGYNDNNDDGDGRQPSLLLLSSSPVAIIIVVVARRAVAIAPLCRLHCRCCCCTWPLLLPSYPWMGGRGRWSVMRCGHSEKKRSIRVGTRSQKWPTKQQGGRSQKNTSLKNAPLSPQVHTADIPRDLRRHMAKKAKIS